MSQINIKPDESIIFERYFSECDKEKCGKVHPTDANKFFLKSGLPLDDLYKINEYCGANRLGYFGRSQFYIALRAIALAQEGHCVDEQIIHLNIQHVPPRFDHQVSAEAVKTVLQKSFETSSVIPPPPNKYHMRTLSGNNILHDLHQRSLMNRQPYLSPTAKLHGHQSLKGSLDQFSVKFNSFDQTDVNHSSFFESDDDENNVESYEEDENKGLINPIIKTELNRLYSLNGDDVEFSSSNSSDHESSSFTGESETDDNEDCACDSHDPTGYMLMEPVEGLAVTPKDAENNEVIPMASAEQLEYYTKCFQTIQSLDTGKVFGSDAINFFQLYHLEDEHIEKILFITNIVADSEISLVQFSRALHLITHQKTGFYIPDKVPENLLPVDFEQPDEPFSFDLSTGELSDMLTVNAICSRNSARSADGDHSDLDTPDVAVNRGWTGRKVTLDHKTHKTSFLSKSFNSPPTDLKEELLVVSRPRPSARKVRSFSQVIPSPVAPPPPPRSNMPSDRLIKTLSLERYTDPCGDGSTSSSSSDKCGVFADDDSSLRKRSESSKSDLTASRKQSTNSEARRLLLTNIRESKSKNHVLLRLNNEMTSELDELREQRVNLHLQLEYIKQSQFDSQ